MLQFELIITQKYPKHDNPRQNIIATIQLLLYVMNLYKIISYS